MGQFLYYWYLHATESSRHSGVGLDLTPDAISVHPYPSRLNSATGQYYPMPETNVPYSSIEPGCTAANNPSNFTSVSSTEPTHLYCRDSVISVINQMGNPSTGILSQANTVDNYSYFPTSTPVWNTESSYGIWYDSDQGTTTATSPTDAHDDSLTNYIDQSYVARQIILTAASGDAFNAWYQTDNTTWGPLYFLPAKAWQPGTAYSVGNFIWDGVTIQECTTAGTSGNGPSQSSFNNTSGQTTSDNTVTWTAESTNWTASTSYAQEALVWDGTHVQEAQEAECQEVRHRAGTARKAAQLLTAAAALR